MTKRWKENTNIPNITKVENAVLECIKGQNIPVRQILTAVYRAITFQSIKSNILLIGKSGTGKTETVTQIAKRLHIPYTIEDGYYGSDVNEMVYNLIDNANNDIESAQRGIIIIDEIDKKAGIEEHDVAGPEVLKSLLKIIEGTTIKITDPNDEEYERTINFDTRNIIIIFSGAFDGLDKIRDKRLVVNPIGFTTSNNNSLRK